ncbi:hypothetical protein TWF970_010797 [Orbilia oligospora]|uniref:Uncharacterized protein n=1 Tax=Orbilia oligospora TaxID=2813651 RepID=A0A7C8R9C4_ORBOL|nr:hypothetical protein TWF970_010797 [Orbilia oligospora]
MFELESHQGPTAVEFTLLDAVADAMEDKAYLAKVFNTWKNSGESSADGLLHFQFHTAKFIRDHVGWIIRDDTQPIIDTFLQIIDQETLMDKEYAKYLLSSILKGTFASEDMGSSNEGRYQSCLATTATVVEKLWQKRAISILQARQWVFFQHWMWMERRPQGEIALSHSLASLPETWPICIEGRESPAPQRLPGISAWYDPARMGQNSEMDALPQNQTPFVASTTATTQIVHQGTGHQPADTISKDQTSHDGSVFINTASENIGVEGRDKSPISNGNSPIQSITGTGGSQPKVSSEPGISLISTAKTPQGVRVGKDHDLEKRAQPLESSKRRQSKRLAANSSRRKQPRKQVIKVKREFPFIRAERDGQPGSSINTPLTIND